MKSFRWPSTADLAVCRRNAAEISSLLGSKPVRYHRETIGEPKCHYKIGLHAGDFWFTIKVSDRAFVLFGEHRHRDSQSAAADQLGFVVALKHPWQNMVATKHLPVLSTQLGVDVFTQPQRSEAACAALLLHRSVIDLIARVSFASVHRLFLSSFQLCFTSDFDSSAECANQALLLRELLLTVHSVAARSKAQNA